MALDLDETETRGNRAFAGFGGLVFGSLRLFAVVTYDRRV